MSSTSSQPSHHDHYARDPATWVQDARRHLAVAELLVRRMDELRGAPSRDFYEFSGCFYSSYFHASVAIETAYKAILISRDPAIIENGGIRRGAFPQGGHKLLAPVSQLVAQLSDDERYLLAKLEDYVELGRYSVPKDGDKLTDPSRMDRLRNAGLDEMGQIRRLVERLLAEVPKP